MGGWVFFRGVVFSGDWIHPSVQYLFDCTSKRRYVIFDWVLDPFRVSRTWYKIDAVCDGSYRSSQMSGGRYMYMSISFLYFFGMLFSRGRGLRMRGKQGGRGTTLRMSGSRMSTVAVLGALNVAEQALKNKGLFPASPSRVGDTENPTWFFVFF